MNFNKPKHQVINDAHIRAMEAVNYNMNQLAFTQTGSVKDVVGRAISDGIRAAIDSLVNDTYTDEQFEQDIGLKP
jgi:hypothetical protein